MQRTAKKIQLSLWFFAGFSLRPLREPVLNGRGRRKVLYAIAEPDVALILLPANFLHL